MVLIKTSFETRQDLRVDSVTGASETQKLPSFFFLTVIVLDCDLHFQLIFVGNPDGQTENRI